MAEEQGFSRFSVVDKAKNHVSMTVPCLFNDQERSVILQTLLLKRKAISNVRIHLESNSVIITYDSDLFSEQALLKLLGVVLLNFSEKPRINNPYKRSSIEESRGKRVEVSFLIEGMSCSSCALFIEMVLSRDPGVVSASVNYEEKVGAVVGYLSKEAVFYIIEKNGFRASLK